MNQRSSLGITTRLATVLAIAVFLLSQGCRRSGSQTDEQKIQGDWVIVKLEAKGKEFPAEANEKDRLHWIFSGNKLHLKTSEMDREFTFQLDPKRSPKHIDTVLDADNQYRGIYELNGDELKICQVHIDVGVERPTEFNAKDRGVLMIFRRAKP